jgi:glycosyltransferase involved in cell wall biosynthesis
MARLRVLYLTHHGPLPASSGGRLRDAQLIPELARLADLEVWAVSRSAAADRDALSAAPLNIRFRVFPDESSPRPYPTRDSRIVSALLAEEHERFDVIHIEGHYLFHLLPQSARYRSVVVEHNIESHLLAQAIAHGSPLPVSDDDIETVRRVEAAVWAEAGLILTLSRQDRDRILQRLPTANVLVTANGADHFPPPRTPDSAERTRLAPHFGFLANYAYPPNADALSWLAGTVFPLIRKDLPGSRLLLAGSNLKAAVAHLNLPDGIEVVGWVASASEFLAGIDVALCPLRIGGGVKVKMLETARSCTPAVATSISLEGLPRGIHSGICVADSAAEFASAAIRLGSSDSLRLALRAKLRSIQAELPTWGDAAAGLYSRWAGLSRFAAERGRLPDRRDHRGISRAARSAVPGSSSR